MKDREMSVVIALFNSVDDDMKFIITKLIYFAGLYNDELCRLVLKFAKDTQNQNYRYWTTQDISRFTFRLQKGFYKGYYNDRKRLLKQIAIDMNLNIPQRQYKGNNSLCIITSMLDKSLKNSTQRVTTMLTKGLLSQFEQIKIFPLDIFANGESEIRKLTTVLPYQPSFLSKESIKELLPPGVLVHYPQGKNYMEKAQDILNSIYEYNPRVILDISDDYSAISYYYSKDFYTCYLSMRDTNSSSFYSVITGSPKWKFIESNAIFNSVDISRVREWNFPEYVPPKTHSHSRAILGIPENSFVLITIGNNATCFSENFVNSICNLIGKNDMVWLLVGQGAPEYLKQKYVALIEQRKVIEHGYETELFSLCSVCDVLVRPNITGGSGATAIAAMAGLPIAMTKFLCDASRWLGVDYSKIDTYNDLAVYIEQLCLHRDFYELERDRCMELVRSAVDSKEKWISLVRILKGGE